MSKLKKWLVCGGVAAAVVVLLATFAPTLLSLFGVARVVVRDAVAEQVQGTVEIDHVRVRWRGPQVVEGLRITDLDGAPVADVDVRVAGGLLALLGGDPIEVAVDGAVEGRIREDNTLSWQDLLVQGEPPPAGEVPEPARSIAVAIERLELRLHDDIADRTVDLDWRGSCDLRPGGKSDIHLTAGGESGETISIDVETFQLVDTFGTLTPNGAGLDATVTVEAMPLLATEIPGAIERLTLTARADDLARRVILTIDGDTTTRSAPDVAAVESHLEGQLVWATPVSSGGLLRFSPTALTGTIAGNDVPTGLFQIFVGATGIDLARDVGPTFDVSGSLPGETGGFALDVVADAITIKLMGTMDADAASATLDASRLHGRVRPELLHRLTGSVTTAETMVIAIDIEHGAVTLDADLAPIDLQLDGIFSLDSPAVVAVGEEPAEPLLELEPFTTRFRLADETVEFMDADVAARLAGDDPIAIVVNLAHAAVALPGWEVPSEDISARYTASIAVDRGDTRLLGLRDFMGTFSAALAVEKRFMVGGGGTVETIDRVTGRQLEITISDFEALVTSSGLADGVKAAITGRTELPDSAPGQFEVRAGLSSLVDADGALALEDAVYDAEVTAELLPTAIVDGLANFDGLMAAAFGASFDADAESVAFSRSGGRFEAHVRSPQGSVRCVGNGREKTMHIGGDDRATAQILLSPLFRRDLASRICPIFLDVLSDDPVIVTAKEAVVPLDGDPRRLVADLHIEFGELRFTSESPTMGGINRIVAMFAGGAAVGSIEPTDIRIRDGVAHIDALRFVIADHPCTMRGTVDMVTNTLDLRMGVPAQIAKVARVRELAILDGVLDLAIRGPAESPTIEPVLGEIDPEKVIKDIFDVFKRSVRPSGPTLALVRRAGFNPAG